jgi:hypothetical protein
MALLNLLRALYPKIVFSYQAYSSFSLSSGKIRPIVKPLAPAEPHTVTFVFDNKTMINGFLPANQRVFSPAIIDSSDIEKIYPPNASLTITGSEKYVNSGWMFPNGPLPGSSSTFSGTFHLS